jgi:hypothetical protein
VSQGGRRDTPLLVSLSGGRPGRFDDLGPATMERPSYAPDGHNVGRWNTEDRSGEGEIIINSLFTAPKGPAHDTRQNPLLMARLIIATYFILYALGSDSGSQPWARDRHQKQIGL